MSSHLDALYRKTNAAYVGGVQEQWRAAAEWDFAQFVQWLHRLELDPNNALFEIFESLTKSDDIPLSFFVNEVRRLLKLAETRPREIGLYTPLAALAFIEPDRAGFDDLVNEALAQFQSSVPQVRRAATSILNDLVYSKHIKAVARLRDAIHNDPDWRVRCMAHSALVDLRKEEPSMPPPPQLWLLDRFRQQWRAPHGAVHVAA